jgi:D-3-phosphoglycerate dehydrogenase
VVGFGLIGRATASKALGLFGRVLVHDVWLTPTDEYRAAGYVFSDSLEALLAEADIVSLHLPLTSETTGLLNAERLKLMKPHGYLINVSRGGLIDEAALIDAIRAGGLAGAALDTFEREPLGPDSPLLAEPRILLSPHVAWLSDEAELDLRRMAAAELALILQGKTPNTPV